MHDEVVDAHGDEVDADAVVAAGLDSELELGAHPVIGRHQDGIGKPRRLQIEEPAEAAERPVRAGAGGRRRQRRHGAHQGVAGLDIDTGVAIGQAGDFGHRTFLGHRSLLNLRVIWPINRIKDCAVKRLDESSPCFRGRAERQGRRAAMMQTGARQMRRLRVEAGRRLHRRVLAIGGALAVMAAAPAPALAQASGVYVVAKLAVDATAKDAVAAKKKAMGEARRQAMQRLLKRITSFSAYERLPKIKAALIQDLLEGFSVRRERNSATRYLATLDFTFRPHAVQQLLAGYGIPFTDRQAPSIRVLPVYLAAGKIQTGRSDVWRRSWLGLDLSHALTPVNLAQPSPSLTPEVIKSVLSGRHPGLRDIAGQVQGADPGSGRGPCGRRRRPPGHAALRIRPGRGPQPVAPRPGAGRRPQRRGRGGPPRSRCASSRAAGRSPKPRSAAPARRARR